VSPRRESSERDADTLRRTVGHEALVSLAPAGFGVPTPSVLAFTTVEPEAYVLAYEAIKGESLDRVSAEELSDDLVGSLWQQLRVLRAHRIARRDLRLANLFRTDDRRVMLIDFGFSELAPSGLLLATDLAELLTSLALVIGPERSVSCSASVLGSDTLASAAPGSGRTR
jgi:glycosyltransferase 2 family protein